MMSEPSVFDKILGYKPYTPYVESGPQIQSEGSYTQPFSYQGSRKTDFRFNTSAMGLAVNTLNEQADLITGAAKNLFLEKDDFFSPLAEIETDPNYEMHRSTLQHAKSKEHFDWLLGASGRDMQRATMAENSTWGANLVSLPLDLTNLIPGVVAFKSVKTAAKIGNAALSGLTVSAGEESLRYLSEVNFSVERAAANMAANTALSAAIGGSVDLGQKSFNNFVVDAHRNNRARQQEINIMEELQSRNENYEVVKRQSRNLGFLEDHELTTVLIHTEERINGLSKGIEKIQEFIDQGSVTANELDDLANLNIRLAEAHAVMKDHTKEAADRRIDAVTAADGTVDRWALEGNSYVNPVPSPWKTALGLKPIIKNGVAVWDGLSMYKDAIMKIADDKGVLKAGNRTGHNSPDSVASSVGAEKRHWQRILRLTETLYAEHANASTKNLFSINPSSAFRTISGTGQTVKQFTTEANRKRIFQEEASSEAEAKLIAAYAEFYGTYGDRIDAIDSNGNRIQQRINIMKRDHARATSRLEMVNITPRTRAYFENRIKELEDNQARYESALSVVQSGQSRGQVREPFFNRVWNHDEIEKNIDEFRAILKEHYTQNPSIPHYNESTKLFERKVISLDDNSVDEAVENTIDSILGELDPYDTDMMASLASSNRLAHRLIDIENKKVFNFIMNDPKVAMQNYGDRVSAKLHWDKIFKGKSPKEVWTEIEDQLRVDGYDDKFINKARLQYNVLEGRVMSSPLRNPDRWDFKWAQRLKEFASLDYLSTSGIASVPDFGRIIMEFDHADTMTGVFKMFNSPDFRQAMRDVKDEFGEALDIALGAAHQRLETGFSRDIDTEGLWNQTRQAGHILNGLGPITELMKTFDGALRVHTLIKYAKNHADGTASQYESDYMTRYGFTVAEMKEIVEKAPLQMSGKFNLAQIHAWEVSGVSKNTTLKFRNAVNTGILNTVVSATPADRPTMSDGVLYMPTHIVHKLPWGKNLKEDELNKGYIRVESGAMTLPFQFYSFMFASMNKVTNAYATGHVKNRVTGAVAALGLGYISVMLKTPDYIWDRMEEKDKLARAFDYSGLASLHSTLIFDSMQQTLAAGGDPYFSKFVDPKFRQEPNAADFVTGFTGAATSSMLDIGRGAGAIASGEFKEGLNMFYNSTPLTGTIPVKMLMDEIGEIFGSNETRFVR